MEHSGQNNATKATVYVQGISPKMNHRMLCTLFKSKVGPLISAFVHDNPANHPSHPLCYGFVRFARVEDAQRAVLEMNDFWEPLTESQLTVRPYAPKKGPLPQHQQEPQKLQFFTHPIVDKIQLNKAPKQQQQPQKLQFFTHPVVDKIQLNKAPKQQQPQKLQFFTHPIVGRNQQLNKAPTAPSSSASLGTIKMTSRSRHYCVICKIEVIGRISMNQHLVGKRHVHNVLIQQQHHDSAAAAAQRNAASGETGVQECWFCNRFFENKQKLDAHLRTRKHAKKVALNEKYHRNEFDEQAAASNVQSSSTALPMEAAEDVGHEQQQFFLPKTRCHLAQLPSSELLDQCGLEDDGDEEDKDDEIVVLSPAAVLSAKIAQGEMSTLERMNAMLKLFS